ncbi:MAG: carboxypeptidase regulatory-like domain-containing protein [Bacteroidales bacterium]|nr:carboxypeptidase regulatory-like domain-containing protein [Bacteroidales bacterium]MCF8402814.1 carboxypeptidase regulatory-like domain-containing protein [Bacteroidales bacterium]
MKNLRNLWQLILSATLVFTFNSSFAQNSMNGIVIYLNAEQTPLANVDVLLLDMEGELLQTTSSNETGNFSFTGLEAGTYKVTAQSDQEPLPFIDLLDVSLLIDYLNNQVNFTSVQEMLANVNGISEVDEADLNFLLENWYLNGENFPVGNWIFEEKTVFVGGKDGQTTITGGCVGDVSSDYEPDKSSSNPIADFNVVDIYPNSTIELAVITDYAQIVKNFFIEIDFDPFLLNELILESPLPGLKYTIENNLIRIIWADINGKGLALCDLDNLITFKLSSGNITNINPDNFGLTENCSFVNGENQFANDIALKFAEPVVTSKPNHGFDIYPIPLSANPTFQYELPYEGNVNIEFINTYGQTANRIFPGQSIKGYNQFSSHDLDLASGYYIAMLRLNGQLIGSKKVIVR